MAELAELDRRGVWEDDGCRDIGHWIATHLGVSASVGARWVAAANALPRLPRLSAALETAELPLDKVVHLTRFVTPEDEDRWIKWARRVTVATVRAKAEVMSRPRPEEAAESDRLRHLHYWYVDDGKLFEFAGLLPADQGAVVARALDRIADDIARSPADVTAGHPDPESDTIDQRRADALVLLASQALTSEADADRATVVVQAELDALVGDGNGALERGGVVTNEALRKLTCDARVQTVVSDGGRGVVGIGRAARTVPGWLMKQLRHRDRGCTFPGCGATRYVHAHHIRHWVDGGRTDLDNLVLVCGFHHKLVHEHRWNVRLAGTSIEWTRPDGRVFEPGLPRGPGSSVDPSGPDPEAPGDTAEPPDPPEGPGDTAEPPDLPFAASL